jgi:glycosyltransferase involved in cell wall biosynthesis
VRRKRILLIAGRTLEAIEHGNGRSAHDVIAGLRALRCDVRLPYLEEGDTFAIRWKHFWQRRFLKPGVLVVVNGLGSVKHHKKAAKQLEIRRDVLIVRESPRHYLLRGERPEDFVEILNRFRHRVFVSSIARDRWLALGVRAERSHYLPNTINSRTFGRGTGTDPDLSVLAPDRVNVLIVGSFQHRKAQDFVVETVLASPELSERARFVFIGTVKGEYGDRVVERAAGSAAFAFVGQKAELAEWYRRADIVLQPSRAEAMSRVMLEALMSGVPFVCTDIEGAGEVIRAGDGVLFPVDDGEALTAALLRLMSDPSERRALGERGRRRFAETYAWPRYIERWRALLPVLRGRK